MLSGIHHLALLTIGIVATLLCSNVAFAHESHDTQIQQLDNQLDAVASDDSNESIALILRRADLHRRQSNWDQALLDYQRIADLEPDNPAMLLGRAQLHLDRHEYELAAQLSTRVLDLEPTHANAGLQHARALAGMGDTENANSVFSQAIEQLKQPRPEHYIEQARVLLANKNVKDTERQALAILDNGANTLGHPVSLHSFAYEIEMQAGQRQAALQRIDKVLAMNSSLLNWRLRRGELLLQTGLKTQAHKEILCLLKRIGQLPAQRRGSQAFQTILQRSEDILATINKSSVVEARQDNDVLVSEC